jgi:hypothetical protein
MFASRLVLAALPNAHFGFLDLQNILPLTLAYVSLMIPYFFAGLLVGGALQREPGAGGVLYFSSLAGSAAGCLRFVALITPVGATVLLQLLFLAATLPALILSRPTSKTLLASTGAVAMATLILAFLPINPDRVKQYWTFPGEPVEFSEWNPISRIDVISSSQLPWKKFILIDGDAQAPMFSQLLSPVGTRPGSLDTPHRQALYALARPDSLDRALVIGVGGGADVLTAKQHGAKHVDAVEMNPTSARIVQSDFAEFTGHLFSRAGGVTLYNEDGRSFAARSPTRYDAVMLFAVDSLAASSTGAYVLMENYLYTLEAFRRYWQLLTEAGLLQIGRWHHPHAPSETLRVFTQAYEALSLEGVQDPGQHIAVVGDSQTDGAPFADIIISKRPVTHDQADALREFAESNHFEVVYLHPTLTSSAGPANAFRNFSAAYAAGKRAEFYRLYPFNVVPVTDDKPFFFSYRRWSDVLPNRSTPSIKYYDNITGTKPLVLLIALVALVVLLVVLLVVVSPMFAAGDRYRPSGADSLMLAFFSLIGVGFMFIEIPLIQRFVLLLGHPPYSMSITLPGILLGASLGSFLSSRGHLTPSRRVGIAAIGIGLGIAALQIGHGTPVHTVLGWPLAARLASVGFIAATFGVFMGIPFPTAVAALASHRQLIPLGWTVNGGTTVLASVVAIPIAMTWGFSAVLIAAVACYIAAWLALTLWWSKIRSASFAPKTSRPLSQANR